MIKTLKEHQVIRAEKAAAIIRLHGVCLCAMDTRTGKTATAFQTAANLGAKRVLFLSKKSIIKASSDAPENDYRDFGFDKFFEARFLNYESLHKIEDRDWHDFLVCDESHVLGAFPKPGVTARMLSKLPRRSTMLLSATPSPESFSALFNQINCVSTFWPQRDFYQWVREGYVIPEKIRIGNGEYRNTYKRAVWEKIDPIVESIRISCSRQEAGIELVYSERNLYVTMTQETKRHYHEMNKYHITTIRGVEALGDSAAKRMSKLHQICSGTCIDDTNASVVFDRSKGFAILQDIRENGYQKVVIFYKYKAERELLENVFENLTTSSVSEFKEGTFPIFISQFLSGRQGLRLDTADALYFYNIDFSYVSFKQVKDRIVSMDRKKPAEIVYVVSAIPGVREGRSFEELILARVSAKKKYTASHFSREEL